MSFFRLLLFVVLTLAPFQVAFSHSCNLRSWPIEYLLFLGLLGYPFILNRNKNRKIEWKNLILAPILGLGLGLAYVTWLHSSAFPRGLLTGAEVDSRSPSQLESPAYAPY